MQSLPPLRGLPPLRPTFPPCARPPSSRFAFPPCAALLPPCAASPLAPDLPFPPPPRLPQAPLAPPLRCPPLRGFPPYARRCRAATLTLAPLRVAAPASATAPPLARRGAACAGGWPSSPRRHAFGVHGWAPGGTRSLALARLRLGQGPRRTVRLPAAPESLPQGSAPRNGAASARAHCGSGRYSATSVGGLILMPPLQALIPTRYAVGIRSRASFKSAENGGFPTPLVRPRLPRPFFSLISALWASTGPPRLHFIQKMASKGAARPPATHPEPFRYAKISGSLAFGGLPARRGLWTAPGTVPNAQSASGLGSGLAALRGYDLSILGHFYNSPLSKTSLHAQRPRFA